MHCRSDEHLKLSLGALDTLVTIKPTKKWASDRCPFFVGLMVTFRKGERGKMKGKRRKGRESGIGNRRRGQGEKEKRKEKGKEEGKMEGEKRKVKGQERE